MIYTVVSNRFLLDAFLLPVRRKNSKDDVPNIELTNVLLWAGRVHFTRTPDRSLPYVVLGLGLAQLSVVYKRFL